MHVKADTKYIWKNAYFIKRTMFHFGIIGGFYLYMPTYFTCATTTGCYFKEIVITPLVLYGTDVVVVVVVVLQPLQKHNFKLQCKYMYISAFKKEGAQPVRLTDTRRC